MSLPSRNVKPGSQSTEFGYTAALDFQDSDPTKDNFIHYQPNGALFAEKEEVVVEEPEIDYEELNKRRLEALERDTYQQAFASGEQAGLELGEQKIALVLERMSGVIKGVEAVPQNMFVAAEKLIVETAVTLLQELFKHELSVNPEGIVERVRAILREAGERDEMILRLNPQDAEVVRNIEGLGRVEVQADETIVPGSVRLDTDFGSMEDDMQVQVQEMEKGIRGFFASRLESLSAGQVPTDSTT